MSIYTLRKLMANVIWQPLGTQQGQSKTAYFQEDTRNFVKKGANLRINRRKYIPSAELKMDMQINAKVINPDKCD